MNYKGIYHPVCRVPTCKVCLKFSPYLIMAYRQFSIQTFTRWSTHGSRTKEIRVDLGEEDEFLTQRRRTKSLIFKTDVFGHATMGRWGENSAKLQQN